MGDINPSATPGRIVHYTLNADDTRLIDTMRHNGLPEDSGLPRVEPKQPRWNPALVGQTYPAIVVMSWANICTLQVFLDGNDTYWAPSRKEGEGQGEWAWPKRV